MDLGHKSKFFFTWTPCKDPLLAMAAPILANPKQKAIYISKRIEEKNRTGLIFIYYIVFFFFLRSGCMVYMDSQLEFHVTEEISSHKTHTQFHSLFLLPPSLTS
jgi:hypothetical protein